MVTAVLYRLILVCGKVKRLVRIPLVGRYMINGLLSREVCPFFVSIAFRGCQFLLIRLLLVRICNIWTSKKRRNPRTKQDMHKSFTIYDG